MKLLAEIVLDKLVWSLLPGAIILGVAIGFGYWLGKRSKATKVVIQR